uniref:Carbohydrate kinase PfkB domain-containing protein n=1 Tax=Rhodosorus marinus TaxID=101924 RepID=A0A7S3ENN4_9RHOD|mmetsp:Transcript_5287/g.22465  ORF Transcript_5287/g.22465 Transcript_5287/m.22465 type:complete len:346 (+) Transcript_5287:465-1502(+)|eukprot:CAMPEP_0113957830 /NCGR_PEP_ID=MMETSP0011_2-20120614/2999_1 /TAXON_ID=101924 /ORGANISM="Rhodosorus marinus" /LENGTH=345 /DNA_ID=CAMNT_0000968459 /DNA_START=343 /DNA_END=1380 /DNA_ORIENTATION=+ /assembly_acc=CAM_ASM_000156
MAFVMSPGRSKPVAVKMVDNAVPTELRSLKVVGLGAAAIDLLASVDTFPNPDDKIRTVSFEVAGGGNCANTLTAVRRLGIPCSILTKIGDDGTGKQITSELDGDGVDTSNVIVQRNMNSPFTYVLTERAGGTRTCIHTPAESELLPSEVKPEWLDEADHLHLDGRHTQAAIEMAKLAIERGVPISLDVEKDRPHIRELLPLADFIITNQRYPTVFGEDVYRGMHTLLRLGRAKFVVTTLGADGSLLMCKGNAGDHDSADLDLNVMEFEDEQAVLIRCPAEKVHHVVDSTGAGDAFIGGIIYSLVSALPLWKMLKLSSRVASLKLGQPGARKGLPLRPSMDQELLA